MNQPSKLTVNDWTLNISTLLYVIALLGVAPYLPRYAIRLGAGEAEVSLLATSYAITAIVLRLAVGSLNDRGYSRLLMISGGLLNTLALLLYLLADSLALIYVGRLTQGVSVALFVPASLYSASITGVRAQKVIAWRATMWGLGSVLGPALLGFTLARSSWEALFYTAITASLASASMSFFYKQEMPNRISGNTGDSLLTRSFILASLTLFIYVIGYQSLAYFLPSLQEEKMLPELETTAFFTIMATLNLASRISLSLRKEFDPVTVALTGVIASIIGYTIVALNPLAWESLIAAGLIGIGLGLLFPALQIISLLGVSEHKRGVAASIYTAMFDLGALIGPPIVITISGGYRESLIISALIIILTLIPVIVIENNANKPAHLTGES